jgi:hypothetical protein
MDYIYYGTLAPMMIVFLLGASSSGWRFVIVFLSYDAHPLFSIATTTLPDVQRCRAFFLSCICSAIVLSQLKALARNSLNLI